MVLTDPPGAGTRPLTGIRVIDAATFIAAPFCATLLGEFGAEVIKVELPGDGDSLRRLGTNTDGGDTLLWLSEARNKKCVSLDLRTERGADLFKELVATADVVCENFRAGTLERWGVGFETLQAIHPGLVMLRVTGYGQTGPYAQRPGFGRIGNGFGGISYLAGDPDRPPAIPGSATLADYLSGIFGAFGVLVALRARDQTGIGQVVDVGLYEPIFRILDELAPAYAQTGYVRQRMGAGTVNAVPHSHYQTKCERWVAIACTNDKIFDRLAALMGCPDIAREGKYGTVAQREAARADVDALVAGWCREHDRETLLTLCSKASVPCGPVYAIDEIFDDPQYRARGNIAFIDDPRVGRVAVPNTVPRLTATPGGIDWLGPEFSAHVDEVFSSLLGLSAEEIRDLRDQMII